MIESQVEENSLPPFLDETTINNMVKLGNGDGDYAERLLIVQLMNVYLDNLPERVNELRGAMRSKNIEILTRAAHTLKSCSRLIGLNALSADCELLEDMCFANDLQNAQELVTRIENAVAKVPTVITNKILELEPS